MKKILQLLKDNPAFLALKRGQGDLVVSNTSDEALLLASAFLASNKTMVLVKENLYEAQQSYQQLSSLLGISCLFFPVDETLRIEALASSNEILHDRLLTLHQLSKKEKVLLVTCPQGLIRYLPHPSTWVNHYISLEKGMHYDIFELQKRLIDLGYRHEIKVDVPLTFTRRGGVIDVYSLNYDYPVRIEFFDDEIESLRFYDSQTQRTKSMVDHIDIIPATDLLYEQKDVEQAKQQISILAKQSMETLEEESQKLLEQQVTLDFESLDQHETHFQLYKYYALLQQTASLLDYVDHPLILCSSYSGMNENYKLYVQEIFQYQLELYQEGKCIKGLSFYHDLTSILLKGDIMKIEPFKKHSKDITFASRSAYIYQGSEQQVAQQIKDYLSHCRMLVCLSRQEQIQSFIEMCDRQGILYTLAGIRDEIYDGLNIYQGNLPTGIELLEENVVILTSQELFGQQATVKKSYFKYKDAKVIKDFNELHVGDYVVHDMHGIGQYMGIKTLEVEGYHKDYLYIAYRGNDILYIPVEQFKLVRKYTPKEGKVPKIHKLGSSEWAKTKQRVKEKVDGLADRLVELYASRMSQKGFAFNQDDENQILFESQAGFQLTEDQERSIQEIKEDMESPIPMDRLLCGDVGFGKTEVALVAAFKAILSGKQVAFLCPTTILSNQHYRTIQERFKQFPVSDALLNRFTTTTQRKDILKKLKEGQIDIIVGTHRILSKDVVFKDIGLLIVDEEQRFGVLQKERIKELKKTVDVLTLSATPIPRTLQMSLMGIRGLSQIETPPKDRLPIQTYVIEKNPKMINQIIARELARDGQVFYLYNNTHRIDSVAHKIALENPHARVVVAHGQMPKNQLEDIMLSFIQGDYNVLVCTTIIETGIDIPNANTMIVEDADHFGLSQLYQIRGRVGRSHRHAYAYFLYRGNKQLNEVAAKRLKALKEFTELGSGYKIALRDLSIRGAGDILGGEQAGFIDTVGFDMYMKILQEAIDEKMGHQKEETEDIPVTNVSVDGYIPHDYVNSDLEKLQLYQRLESANTLSSLKLLEQEFKDVYGKLPSAITTLLDKRRYDILVAQERIDHVEDTKQNLQITLTKACSDHIQGDRLFELCLRLSHQVKVAYMRQQIKITFPKEESWLDLVIELLSQLKNGSLDQ